MPGFQPVDVTLPRDITSPKREKSESQGKVRWKSHPRDIDGHEWVAPLEFQKCHLDGETWDAAGVK